MYQYKRRRREDRMAKVVFVQVRRDQFIVSEAMV